MTYTFAMNNPRPPINLKTLPSWLLIALVWLISKLPLRVIRVIGAFFGVILWALARQRRFVALTNLRLCFPDMPDDQRKKLVFWHCIRFAQAVLDRSLMWFASEKRIRRIVRQHNEERLTSDDGRPTLVLAPHFVGLDATGTRASMMGSWISMYAKQKNPVLNYMLLHGRGRFTNPILVSRLDGLLKVVKAIKRGTPFYYLPDQDFGPKDAVFAPFFGFPAATVTGVSRLAQLTNARVIAIVSKMVPDGYESYYTEEWENFPGASVEEDTARMNKFIESWVLQMPDQYFWLHKRFKTRPEGEPSVYGKHHR